MVNIAEFSRENQELMDIHNVLEVLVNHADLRANPVFCELLIRFSTKIRDHLDHEDRSMYSELLNHSDKEVNNVARKFMDNTHHLRSMLSNYAKRWCRHPGDNDSADERERFIEETRTIFHLIDERISLETNKLFPLFR